MNNNSRPVRTSQQNKHIMRTMAMVANSHTGMAYQDSTMKEYNTAIVEEYVLGEGNGHNLGTSTVPEIKLNTTRALT